jgi:hypothetical protein
MQYLARFSYRQLTVSGPIEHYQQRIVEAESLDAAKAQAEGFARQNGMGLLAWLSVAEIPGDRAVGPS